MTTKAHSPSLPAVADGMTDLWEIRVRGRVQGVGFRPAVWRLATAMKLLGEVLNDADGVLIRIIGHEAEVAEFETRLREEAPARARITGLKRRPASFAVPDSFRIAESAGHSARTEICPDLALCPACAHEIVDPFERRYRYPFTNCTQCGPRFSVLTGMPYDRAHTAMADFPLCQACDEDYHAPRDRRFHAEAIACHACGPRASLIRFDGRASSFDQHSLLDDVDAFAGLIRKGYIVALKGLGGYQLCCDATNADAVNRLRAAKQRDARPFALMARDLDVIRRCCVVSDAEEAVLRSPEGPIVLLDMLDACRLPRAIAPGLRSLGFMLPTTPLHALALRRLYTPVVMTSGNVSGEPQIIDDDMAFTCLGAVADYALTHNRRIEMRLDDSVVRVMGSAPRLIRRGRGYAPAPIRLPAGFAITPDLLAMGGELKATFCLVKDGEAILSQHIGDLKHADTADAFDRTLARYTALFAHRPKAVVVSRHPDYLSAKSGRARALADGLPLIEVQHHHAHVAACLAENGQSLNAPPVLGIVLDGLGYGEDGHFWGGEFLLADYRSATRLGTFKPVAMPGGSQAAREPWRNLYAHLMAEMGWRQFELNFGDLPLHADLAARPRAMIDAMLRDGIQTPLASSCGRLFDAVAAALDICRDRQSYEGEAAMRLEAMADPQTIATADDSLAYPFTIPNLAGSGLPYIEPLAMWNALLGDLILETPAPVIAARFHLGLARALAAMARKLAHDGIGQRRFDAVALSGGCFQNRILFEDVARRLEAAGFTVLGHRIVPANDGGLALGQAAIGAAQLLARHD